MFENYIATKEDIRAVEEALEYIWNPKMNFIFRDKSKIKNTCVISYDSEFIYVWSFKNSGKHDLQKIPHKLKIRDEWQNAWYASPISEQILNLLSPEIKNKNRFERPIINGGLLTPFIKSQKTKNIPNNPYLTKESYLAAIIHEFGHVYWNSYKLWWFSNKHANIDYLEESLNLYENRKTPHHKILFPTSINMSELFAFCTEYNASSIFWSGHKKNLDKYISNILKILIKKENNKDLNQEDSVIETSKQPHNFSYVFGKIITSKYQRTWPRILTQPRLL